MSSSKRSNLPYKNLGASLKRLRIQYKRSVSEVCGAVEINESQLTRIESGVVRPDEEILEQLMNHYHIDGELAMRLWSLAGYDTDDLVLEESDPLLNSSPAKHIIMLLTHQDQSTLYSDSLDIHYDSNGLILNFKQVTGQNQPLSLARLGMSYEQAEKVLATLQKVLLRRKYLKGPKALPKGKSQQV